MIGVFCKFSNLNRELEFQVTRRSPSLVKFAVGFFFFFSLHWRRRTGRADDEAGVPWAYPTAAILMMVIKNMAVSSACSVAIEARVGV